MELNSEGMDSNSITGYRLSREIGAGSFARVYLAQTTSVPTRVVAIKSVLRSRLTTKLLENLEGEINILKSIRHAHIVTLMDITNTGSHIHLIMEYCPLGDLSFFIRNREKLGRPNHDIPLLREIANNFPNVPNAGLNETLVRHFLQQLASALKFLRSKNLMHRDVKPQNLLLQPPPIPMVDSGIGLAHLPQLKLADFGFARYLQEATMAETLCGSPLYMAPEILRSEKYNATIDLWSVGTVLYEMLVGKAPFRASNHIELLRKIDASNDEIKFPRSVVFNVEIQGLIRSLLRRNPKDRLSFNAFFNHPLVTERLNVEIPQIDAATAIQNSMMWRGERSSGVSAPVQVPTNSRSSEQQLGVNYSPAFITDLIPANTPPAPRQVDESEQHLAQRRSAPLSIAPQAEVYKKPEQALLALPGKTEHHPNSKGMMPGDAKEAATSPQSSGRATVDKSRGAYTSHVVTGTPEEQIGYRSGDSRTKMSSPRVSVPREMEGEKLRDSDAEYVVIEKRTVELNAFADAMAQPTRPNLRKYSSGNGRTLSAQPIPTTSPTGINNATVQALATAERRLGSSPASSLAKALSIASQRLFGGGSPPSWLEQMVNNAAHINTPFRAIGFKVDSARWLQDQESLSPEEDSLMRVIDDFSAKSTIVYDFGELKLRQLIPPPPIHSNDAIDFQLSNEAIVSLCEEGIVLYIKTLHLLQKNIDAVQAWLPRGQQQNSQAIPRMNDIVQWTRARYNEVLEKAEYLQRRKSVSLSLVSPDYPFEQITAEKLLYDRALELGRGAAVHEIVGEDLSQCEGDYETSVLMLEAILASNTSVSSSSTFQTEESIEEEDRKVIERWITLTRARWKKLHEKIGSMRALSILHDT